ncbi:type II secretion system protein [Deinococcus wulumuqiensis]|uniref:type II secretion system protein n=1 Tax=Deinococcus wulumuqiensis TaxID=980427 RepID=UPI001E47DB46|nr:type II secretion system protein [Deinococcus wulumuqiensis]
MSQDESRLHRQLQEREQGLTIIELLVAIALLGILTAVLTATLTGSLSLNRQSQKQLDTTTQVQAIVENVRAAWKTQSNYDSACAPSVPVPTGYSVRFINLNSRAAPLNANGTLWQAPNPNPTNAGPPSNPVSLQAACTAATGASVGSGTALSVPALRRLVVQSGTAAADGSQVIGPQDFSLTLDVLRPQE